jgi:hypothetical protein
MVDLHFTESRGLSKRRVAGKGEGGFLCRGSYPEDKQTEQDQEYPQRREHHGIKVGFMAE